MWMCIYTQIKFWSYIRHCTDFRKSFDMNVYNIYKVNFEVLLGSVQTCEDHLMWMYIYKVSFEVILGSVQTCEDHLMWMYIQSKFWSFIRLCTDLRRSFDVNVYIQSKFWSYIRLCTDLRRSFDVNIYKVSFEVILGSVQTCENHLIWMYIIYTK